MSIKRVLCPAQVRQIPAQFSWIDQRLVRDNLIGCCGTHALALYLFLVTVADAQGLSYYSDQSIVCRLSCLDPTRLTQARTELQSIGWIAYEPPLYQVLALKGKIPERPESPRPMSPKPDLSKPTRCTSQPVEVIQILRRALEDRHD
jgi:hypothetical protein